MADLRTTTGITLRFVFVWFGCGLVESATVISRLMWCQSDFGFMWPRSVLDCTSTALCSDVLCSTDQCRACNVPVLSCLFLEFERIRQRKSLPVLVRKGKFSAVFGQDRERVRAHANQVAAPGAPFAGRRVLVLWGGFSFDLRRVCTRS